MAVSNQQTVITGVTELLPVLRQRAQEAEDHRMVPAESVKALALRYRLCPAHTMRLAPLGYLAPDLVAMILEGRHPPTLSLKSMTSAPLPLAWNDQRTRIKAICEGRA